MNCQDARDLLITHLYDELREDQSQALRCHLDQCPACEARFAELARVRGLLASRQDPAPSPLAVQRVLAHAREEVSRPRAPWGLGWVKAAVPLCFMVAVGAWIAIHHWERAEIEAPVSPQEVGEASKPPSEVDLNGTGEVPPKRLEEKTKPAEVGLERPTPAPKQPPAAPSLGRSAPGARAPDLQAPSAPAAREAPAQEKALGAISDEERRGPPRTAAKKAQVPAGSREGVRPSSDALVRGQGLLEARDYRGAEETFASALNALPKGHPERPEALLGLARAKEALGQTAEAKALYAQLADESREHRDMALQRIREIEASTPGR